MQFYRELKLFCKIYAVFFHELKLFCKILTLLRVFKVYFRASFSHKEFRNELKYIHCNTNSLGITSLILMAMSKNSALLQKKIKRLGYAARKTRIVAMSATHPGLPLQILV